MSIKGLFLCLVPMTILLSSVESLSTFVTGPCKQYFCEIILNLRNPLETTSLKDFFFYFWFYSVECYHFSNVGTRPLEKYFCKVILKSIHVHQLERSGKFKFVFLAAEVKLF